MLRGSQRGALQQLLEGDEIARRQGRPDAGLDSVRQLDRVHDALEELGMADVDLVAPQPGGLEAACRERDHLRIRIGPARTDQLGADLIALAPLVETAGVRRHHRPGVAEADRQGGRPELARDETGDGHRPLAHEGYDLAAHVCELEQLAALLGAEAELEHLGALDHWRDHMPVAPPPHLSQE